MARKPLPVRLSKRDWEAISLALVGLQRESIPHVNHVHSIRKRIGAAGEVAAERGVRVVKTKVS